MSEIKTKENLTGKLNAQTITATGTVPEWLQPLIKENGVYIGTVEPTDPTKLVWINPDGKPSPSGGNVDLSNYYTKDETNTEIEQAVQNIDFTPYATKVELEQYDTSAEVDKKIEGIEFPETDLTGLATTEYVDTAINATKAIIEYDIEATYAKKSDIPSLEGYATESYVADAITTALGNIGVAEEGVY